MERPDGSAVALVGELLDARSVRGDEGELAGDEERVREDEGEDCEQPPGAVYGARVTAAGFAGAPARREAGFTRLSCPA